MDKWSAITFLSPGMCAARSCTPHRRHQCRILLVNMRRTADFVPSWLLSCPSSVGSACVQHCLWSGDIFSTAMGLCVTVFLSLSICRHIFWSRWAPQPYDEAPVYKVRSALKLIIDVLARTFSALSTTVDVEWESRWLECCDPGCPNVDATGTWGRVELDASGFWQKELSLWRLPLNQELWKMYELGYRNL
jgi:hypothetical protein